MCCSNLRVRTSCQKCKDVRDETRARRGKTIADACFLDFEFPARSGNAVTSRFGFVEHDDDIAKFHHRSGAIFVLLGQFPERSLGHLLAHGYIEAVSLAEFALVFSG